MNLAEWFFGDLVASGRARLGRLARWVRGGTARVHRARAPHPYDPAFVDRLAARRRHDLVVQSTIPHFDPLG